MNNKENRVNCKLRPISDLIDLRELHKIVFILWSTGPLAENSLITNC